ncbi:hypothetical protein BWK47_02855 [Synechocystis sp. CACIAM 05]|nr:hypothetical protein BWK47_02855 [Synechocystis sp. CACIAM 05]
MLEDFTISAKLPSRHSSIKYLYSDPRPKNSQKKGTSKQSQRNNYLIFQFNFQDGKISNYPR